MTPEPLASVAIGDIHGRLDLLDALLARFPDRRLVFLGDYVDRGPDSPGVLRRVRALVESGQAVACLGNHDLMMIDAVVEGGDPHLWQMNGGTETEDAYLGDHAAMLGDAQWMQEHLKPWHVEGRVLFAHAMRPHPSDPVAHLWGRPLDTPVYPLPAGVTVSVHGHTPMAACPFPMGLEDGTVVWFIDTGAVWTGRLCALDCETLTPSVVRL
ncbi:metallophosphoesterase [Deinococcus apachensis]|uniref:metallophosphoesterase n=1 Tax=Deinococcus apachensis TaxID=309886 RepID=UPI000373EC30|nr:metallophosphoesterase [Deinococcus apachensis]